MQITEQYSSQIRLCSCAGRSGASLSTCAYNIAGKWLLAILTNLSWCIPCPKIMKLHRNIISLMENVPIKLEFSLTFQVCVFNRNLWNPFIVQPLFFLVQFNVFVFTNCPASYQIFFEFNMMLFRLSNSPASYCYCVSALTGVIYS